jgi:hypothetical protein
LISYDLAPLVIAGKIILVTQREERRKDREGGSRWWGKGEMEPNKTTTESTGHFQLILSTVYVSLSNVGRIHYTFPL